MSGSDLDRFMLACSDLNQPAKSRLFQNRPGLKDIKVQPRPAAPAAGFQTSQKARDWSQLDLGDAFSQAAPPPPPPLQQAGLSADSDWDEFADFQSCPPPAPAPSVGGLPAAPAPAPGSVNLLNGLSGGVGYPAAAAAPGGGGLAGNAPFAPAAAPLGYPSAPLSGAPVAPVGFPALSASHRGQQSAVPTTLPVPGSSGGPLAGQGALQNGLFVSSAAPSPSLTGSWTASAEPVPAAGYIPVPAVRPTAKPTRFRQGLVPLPVDPEEDEFAEFVAAEPAPAPTSAPVSSPSQGAATTPAERRRSGGRPSRLPTLDVSPPRRAAGPPPEDLYAALRGLSVAAPADSGELASGAGPGSEGGAPDLLGLDAPLASAADLPPPLSLAPAHLAPVPAPAPAAVNFSTSLGPTMDEFSTSLAPPSGSGPLAPVAAPAADEDEDFGEFVSVEQPVSGGVSSRHGSLPSLDLQVAPASEGGEVSPLEPDRRDTDSDTAPAPAPGPAPVTKQDKYDSFRQEIMSPPSSESALVAEWRRCLQACYELIQEGVALFGSVADQHTCSEVAGSRQGAHYIDNLSRVYRVAGRIERACERHGCRHQLEFILSETFKAWANLTAFVANSPTRAAVADGWSSAGAAAPSAADVAPCCGVCLLPAGAEAGGDEPTLACAGRQYHACCANLWVNRVADVLPALRP